MHGVTAAAPRVNGFAILANGSRSYAAAVVGVDPASEAKISTHRLAYLGWPLPAAGRHQRRRSWASPWRKNLGRQAWAESSTLLGSARDGSVAADVLTVAGVYHSGIPDLDRSILEMPLARAQDTFGMDGAVNTIALGGPSLGAVNRALPALDEIGRRSGVAVRDWKALEPAMRDAIDLKYATSMLFYASLVIVVAFIILNTLLMSVLERTREFGMLLALGMRSGQIGAMVWIELLGLALLGSRDRRRLRRGDYAVAAAPRDRHADRSQGAGPVRHADAAVPSPDRRSARSPGPPPCCSPILRRRPGALPPGGRG